MAPSIPAKRSIWIQGCWRDLILYVGTPLLLIPLFAVAQVRWTAQEIFIFVGAFGALDPDAEPFAISVPIALRAELDVHPLHAGVAPLPVGVAEQALADLAG